MVAVLAEWMLGLSLLASPPDDAASEPAEQPASGPDVDAIVEAAAQAAKDRAWLERKGEEIPEYVRHLDALADVAAQLDPCGAAIQAELRMALALAYLEREGTCTDADERGDGEPAPSEAELPMPVLECFEATGPGDCANRLLDRVAEFANAGPGGLEAPFAAAFGCPHAVAEMSVEQMFGACMVEQYDAAIDRFAQRPSDAAEDVKVWPVPRWASATGIGGGAALVIVGGVLLGIDGKCPGGYDPMTQTAECPSVYDTNVGGGVLVGVGAVAMLGMGAVLTITEIQRKKAGNNRPSALRRRLDRAQALTGLRLSVPRLGPARQVRTR
jgi:hypothetical protein